MKPLLWGGLLLFCTAHGVSAQTPPAAHSALPPVADPSAPVAPIAYRSVFADTDRGVETRRLDWRKANADVGQFKRGHIDILQWEHDQAGAMPGGHAPAGPAAAPVTPAEPVTPAAPSSRQPHRHQEPQ